MDDYPSKTGMGTSKERLEIMSKGSSPRPFSVSQQQYGSNFDAIFRKKDEQREVKDIPRCGCGNSQDPNGYCDGSHSRPSQRQSETKT